ncbi:helix-turn-helix domain-containing protein [Embleya sp. NBC_00896]|uniref:helix-turn-helix domain-containing protein n=1 Tax=Embleya sp. NBC_00896 TaxID=2975961 RepID=UPI00386F97A4|nr:helix-turn-helix domain-containing protein [Embleya sp. NBC_00896]
MSENELGTYLRARREAVKPADVGLPDVARRRTPGLRRSELATLAGVSVEYLARLEQGRDRRPSGQVLAALADALRLSADERVHVRHLAKTAAGDMFPCTAGAPPARSVRPTVRALLDRLEPAPALLVNRLGDVLACTNGYERLAGPLGILDHDEPNLPRYVFTDPRARAAYPDWERIADEHAAVLRMASSFSDPYVLDFLDGLAVSAGTPFTTRLAAPSAPPRRVGVERLVHPEAGELRLEREILDLADADQSLLVYLPVDEATSAALDHLTGRHPGALRAV